MPQLTTPAPDVHASFLAAMAEFQSEGRGTADDHTMVGREIYHWSGGWEDRARFAEYLNALRAQFLEETPRPAGFVPSTTWWWTGRTEYLGRIALRHRLSDRLRAEGGHVGYDVRPSTRRRGCATAMLTAVLPVAAGMGLDNLLLTCDADNTGSRRAIEGNGGVLENEVDGLRRYWVGTSGRS